MVRFSNKRVVFSLFILLLFLWQAFFFGDYLESPGPPDPPKKYRIAEDLEVSADFARELFRVQELRSRTLKQAHLKDEILKSCSNPRLAPSASFTLYVSPNGHDRNPGSSEYPLKTLQAAKKKVAGYLRSNTKPHKVRFIATDRDPDLIEYSDFARNVSDPSFDKQVLVYLRGGQYPLQETVEFTAEDSGFPTLRVEYRSYPNEVAKFVGGSRIPVDAFERVSDPAVLGVVKKEVAPHLVQVNLKGLGITEYGQMASTGFSVPVQPTSLNIYFDGQLLTLARWPNPSEASFSLTGTIIDPGSIPRNGETDNRGGIFTMTDVPETLHHWADQLDDIWMFGYWGVDWADHVLPVSSLDLEANTVTLGLPSYYGLKEKKRFYAMNILAELDQPGEWYLDRKKGVLYLYPPTRITSESEVFVTLLHDPMIAFTGAQYLTFSCLNFEFTRGTAIQMVDSRDLTIRNSKFQGIGNVAVVMGEGSGGVIGSLGSSPVDKTFLDIMWNRRAGSNNKVIGCSISLTGTGGVILGGGDREDLSRGRNAVAYNKITNFSTFSTTYRPAVYVDGVGNYVGFNDISGGPHAGIVFYGNEHVIEYNHISKVALETSDVGAIYTARDWTAQGTVIRFNVVIGHAVFTERFQGVYLDDLTSGVTVYGNVFYSIFRGIQHAGGRSNVISHNFFVNCQIPLMMDARGIGRLQSQTVPGGTVRDRLHAVPYQSDPWISHYPALALILDDAPGAPKYNEVHHNILVNTSKILISPNGTKFITEEDTYILQPPEEWKEGDDFTGEYFSEPFLSQLDGVGDFARHPWLDMFRDH